MKELSEDDPTVVLPVPWTSQGAGLEQQLRPDEQKPFTSLTTLKIALPPVVVKEPAERPGRRFAARKCRALLTALRENPFTSRPVDDGVQEASI